MKTKILTVIALLVITSTQVLARPSLNHMDQKLDTLVACPPGAPTRFVDNGDGTVCDHETGLMWEMKNELDGVQNFINPHDADNSYPWSATSTARDTVFTDFLDRLNGVVASTAASEQFGGYSDWRLPTSAELQTIQDCSFDIPCIDPVFGPTATVQYWSSTSHASPLNRAWAIGFVPGVSAILITNKTTSWRARAVRGNGRALSSPVVRGPVIGIGGR